MKSDKWQEKALAQESLLLNHLAHVLATCHLPPATPLAIAVSGGADSMALALLLHGLGHRITALTVDHGLRAESASEAARVGEWMRARGIAHHILTPAPDASIRNTQSRAREMRYRALTDWAKAHHATALLVGHHADDQAETLALQRHRGDSSPSRAGMALVSLRDDVRLIRPLLGVRKSALIAYLEQQQQPWIDDPSNASDAYARNRLRQTLRDADIVALWHEAQAQGAARHADDLARNVWMEAHVQHTDSGATFPLSAWRLVTDDWRLSTDILSRLLQAIGDKPHRARLHETERLCARLHTDDAGKATLSGCIISWAGDIVSVRKEHYVVPTTDTETAFPRSEGGIGGSVFAPPCTQTSLASAPFWWFNLHPLF